MNTSIDRHHNSQDLLYISNLKSNAEGISRQLRGWANSLQNSDIAGQRHLNDQTKRAYDDKQRGTEFTERIREMAEQAQRERERIERKTPNAG